MQYAMYGIFQRLQWSTGSRHLSAGMRSQEPSQHELPGSVKDHRGPDGNHRGPCRGLQRRHLDMAKGCLSMRSHRVPSAFTRRYIL